MCGNYAGEKSEDVSVGGICAMALRGAIHLAALRKWENGHGRCESSLPAGAEEGTPESSP